MAVDYRASIARELLSTEEKYLQTLEIIHDVFYVPCEAALMSNRAILSSQNVKLIFTDLLQLRHLSRLIPLKLIVPSHGRMARLS